MEVAIKSLRQGGSVGPQCDSLREQRREPRLSGELPARRVTDGEAERGLESCAI